MGRQKVPKSDFQRQFSQSKIVWIFLKFFFIEEHQQVVCYWQFLKTSIFELLCFLKWGPIFDDPCEHLWKSNQKIIFLLLIFLLKSSPCWLMSAKLHHWGHTISTSSKSRVQISAWKKKGKHFWPSLAVIVNKSWYSTCAQKVFSNVIFWVNWWKKIIILTKYCTKFVMYSWWGNCKNEQKIEIPNGFF